MIVPVLMAAGNLAVRTLRGMNLHALSIYFSLSQCIAYGYVMIAFNMGLSFLNNFSTWDYVFLVTSAFLSLANLMLK